jgi:hypothetical protein
MSFRKRINDELAKLSTTDLEQCPVTGKIEDGEVSLGEMNDEQRRLLSLRYHYIHEAEGLNKAHREFHDEEIPADKAAEHEQRHNALLKSIRVNDLITEYLNNAMWSSVQHQVLDHMEPFDSLAIREKWQIVGCKGEEERPSIRIISIGLGGFPFPFMG